MQKPTEIVCFENYLRYCPITGNLYWKVDRGRGVKAGDLAGGKDGKYIRIRLNGKSFLAHRIAYCLYTCCRYSDVPMLDHIDGDGYNNRGCNLRPCTQQGNQANERLSKNSTSGYKGVSYYKRDGNWWAKITHQGKLIHLGYHSTPEAAALAYDDAARKLFGEFARTNFTAIGKIC